MRRIWIRSACLLATFALIAAPSAMAQGKGDPSPAPVNLPGPTTGGPDTFGYTFFDELEAECTQAFTDISGTGTVVTFTPSAGFPADDDGGAAITLMEPFEFYGTSTTSVVMSSNGYLAFDTDLTGDNGGDFSEDCPLPAIPAPAPGTPFRAMAFHDDLSGEGVGTAYNEYFPVCPRAGESGGNESCTIFQWDGWGFFNGTDFYDFQVILYHQSFELVYEIDPAAGVGDPTIAIQNLAATDQLTFQCDAPALAGPKSICFFEPRFPPGSLAGGGLPIPTTSTWGMIILASLLAFGAMIAMRRRQAMV